MSFGDPNAEKNVSFAVTSRLGLEETPQELGFFFIPEFSQTGTNFCYRRTNSLWFTLCHVGF